MKGRRYVLDACALIAFLDGEKGSERVRDLLREAEKGNCEMWMNILNLLEIYYGVYREDGANVALETLALILVLPINIMWEISFPVFLKAGEIKAKYKVSLADSIAAAEAIIKRATLITADHREFDPLDTDRIVRFLWIR